MQGGPTASRSRQRNVRSVIAGAYVWCGTKGYKASRMGLT